MICLLIFVFLINFQHDAVAEPDDLSDIILEIRNEYDAEEECFGVLVAPSVVLASSCPWFETSKLDLSSFKMFLSDEKRHIKNLLTNTGTPLLDDYRKQHVYLLIPNEPFYDTTPVSINGGDLIETCQEIVKAKYAPNEITETFVDLDEKSHLGRDVNPLPYQACRRQVPEMKFQKNDICIIMPTDGTKANFAQKAGSPLLCEETLTGLKLYTKSLEPEKRTVHVYLRLSTLINWIEDLEEIDGAPIWVFLESDYEERMILGTQIRLMVRNESSILSSWFLHTPEMLIGYFMQYLNLSVMEFPEFPRV